MQSTNVTDRQTDGQMDTGRQQRPGLRIASRGKNTVESTREQHGENIIKRINLVVK